MSEEKKGKVEQTAEKTGEVIGKGVKKGWGAVKGFGKGMKDAVTKKEEDEEKK
jgi:hypothetical protein